ncbi:MAG: hypothetical protein GY760_19550 [Deltaproteobacteria bacterium]|nr:hypothetical protein [Deltaproteobacteria bacterium]
MENKKDNKTLVLNTKSQDEKPSPQQKSNSKNTQDQSSDKPITSAMQFTINIY